MKKFSMFAACVVSTSVLAGCNSGEVVDQKETREVSADGKTATQTRTQTRTTPAGATVRETETQKREVISPASGAGGKPDASQPNPYAPR